MEGNIQNTKRENHQPKIIYTTLLDFRYEGKIQALPGKQKLTEFIITRPTLKEVAKGAFLPETKSQKYPKLLR